MEARGGRTLPSQVHWRAAVSDRGAVWTADPWSEGSSRHDEPQPAQPVEGHGGHLYEAQWESSWQPRLQSPTHRVLNLTFLLRFGRFKFSSLSTTIFLPLAPVTSVPAASSPPVLSHFAISLTFDSHLLRRLCQSLSSIRVQWLHLIDPYQPLSQSLCFRKHYLNSQRSSSHTLTANTIWILDGLNSYKKYCYIRY